MQVPNGELTAEQARFLGGAVRKYGEKGCLDITTRANIQLRGVPLEDAGDIMNGLQDVGLTSVQTGKHLLPMCLYSQIGQTGCVSSASHWIVWRVNIVFDCLHTTI